MRFGILVIALLAGFAAVAKGAWDLGVTRSSELKAIAEEQYKRRITLPARRGMITDRHGEELAVEVAVDSVYADALKITDPKATARELFDIIGESEVSLEKKLSSKRNFVWLKRRVNPHIADKIKELKASNKLKGVDLIKESKRYYPSRNHAAHIIGFSGIDAEGLEGIELEFNDHLKGKKSAVVGFRDAKGHVVFADNVFGPEGVVGNTIELTIDRKLQHIVEQELAGTIRTFNASAGHIVVMDPKTGEILALANYPTFNPNSISDYNPDNFRNRAALDVFEPGSTMKVFTLAAAFNTGMLKPDESIYCERGVMSFGDQTKTIIRDDHQDGFLTPNQCLKRSSNICFAKLSMRLGKKRLYSYFKRFGFGEPTRIDLPFESSGVLRHFNRMREVDAAMAAFGQGIGVTNIQMTTALSAIANGGMLMRPMLVKRIINPEGETLRSFVPNARRRVINRYTARLVADMMTSVTEEGGTGIEGALDGFIVAGKTGTAQKAVAGKGYVKDKWVSSFFGFVPADDPKLAISVVIDEPLINYYGGIVAAPLMRRISDQALKYLGVSPNFIKSPIPSSISNKKEATEKSDISNDNIEPEPNTLEEEKLSDDSETVSVPNLLGLSMKQTTERLAILGLRPIFSGTGLAREQNPRAGSAIMPGRYVQVNFSPNTVDHNWATEANEVDNSDHVQPNVVGKNDDSDTNTIGDSAQ